MKKVPSLVYHLHERKEEEPLELANLHQEPYWSYNLIAYHSWYPYTDHQEAFEFAAAAEVVGGVEKEEAKGYAAEEVQIEVVLIPAYAKKY